MGVYRKFTREFKISVLHELESNKLAQVCREHNLHPNLVTRWKKDYDSNPTEAFKGHGNVWKDDAKLAQYERLVGQLYAENAFLKKTLENLKQHVVEEQREKRSYTK